MIARFCKPSASWRWSNGIHHLVWRIQIHAQFEDHPGYVNVAVASPTASVVHQFAAVSVGFYLFVSNRQGSEKQQIVSGSKHSLFLDDLLAEQDSELQIHVVHPPGAGSQTQAVLQVSLGDSSSERLPIIYPFSLDGAQTSARLWLRADTFVEFGQEYELVARCSWGADFSVTAPLNVIVGAKFASTYRRPLCESATLLQSADNVHAQCCYPEAHVDSTGPDLYQLICARRDSHAHNSIISYYGEDATVTPSKGSSDRCVTISLASAAPHACQLQGDHALLADST